MNFLKTFLILFVFVAPLSIQAQKTNKSGSQYQFTTLIDLSTTDVKNQFKSNTCWSYASNSFLESELLRMGKPKTDLSELFIVHNIYLEKAEKFVRMLGKNAICRRGTIARCDARFQDLWCRATICLCWQTTAF